MWCVMKFGITPISFDILDENFDLKNLNFPVLVEKAINAGYQHIEKHSAGNSQKNVHDEYWKDSGYSMSGNSYTLCLW